MANERAPDRRRLLWAGEIARLVLGFAVLALLARTARTEALGTYLAMTSVALLAPRLLDLGLPHAFGYFMRIDPGGLRPAAATLARHVALAVPAALALSYALRLFPFANAEVTALVESKWLELGVLMLSELAVLLGLAVFIPTARFGAYVATIITPPLLFLLAIAAWPERGPEASQLVDLLLVTSLLGCAVMAWSLVRAVANSNGGVFPVAQAYRYGLHTYGSAVAKIAAQRFDRLFLAGVLGASGYAQYSLAISLRDMATFPGNLYATTLRNRQIDLVATHRDLGAARQLLLRVSCVWSALAGGAALMLLPAWPAIVAWCFGPGFDMAASFARIVAFSCAPLAVMGYAWNHLYAMNRPGHVTVLTCGSLALALPAFWVFIHFQGPTRGVAFAVVAWSTVSAAASLAWALASQPAADVPPEPLHA